MTNNQINFAKHREIVRHNKRTEKQTDRSIEESVRHNLATEDLGYANVGLGYSNLDEMYRHNTVLEGETNRHNLAQEEQSKYSTDLGYYNNIKGKPLPALLWYGWSNLNNANVTNGLKELGSRVVEGIGSYSESLQQRASSVPTNSAK